MAESSLDDFFAKKDKSKKKSKSKLKPDDILAQQQEKPARKKKTKNVESEAAAQQTTSELTKDDDAEWEEVAEEQETDYSGLRIQTLQISNKEGGENETEEDDRENGQKDQDDESSGPWNKLQTESASGPPATISSAPPARKDPLPAQSVAPDSSGGKVQSGKYVPPARRNNPGGGSSSTPLIVSSAPRRKPKVAPNLQSEADFPTLGMGANSSDGDKNQRGFEEVKSGGKQMDNPSKKSLNLQLDNKFTALDTD